MFKNVIVKRPCSKITEGITSAPELGKPDYELALKQHDAYIEALKSCGVEVTVLDADENFPGFLLRGGYCCADEKVRDHHESGRCIQK